MIRKRGQLTDLIKIKSQELLGYEISQSEFRLMPYIQYVMTNSQKLDFNRINSEEREILSTWRKKCFIDGGNTFNLCISKKFWDAICELIFIGYVDLSDSE